MQETPTAPSSDLLGTEVAYLSIYLSIYPSIYLSIGLSIYLSLYLPICLSKLTSRKNAQGPRVSSLFPKEAETGNAAPASIRQHWDPIGGPLRAFEGLKKRGLGYALFFFWGGGGGGSGVGVPC